MDSCITPNSGTALRAEKFVYCFLMINRRIVTVNRSCHRRTFVASDAPDLLTGLQGSQAEETPAHNATKTLPADQTREQVREFAFNTPGQMKKVFAKLDKSIYVRCAAWQQQLSEVGTSVETLLPLLDQMQALLSQRGTNQVRILKKAKLPTWTEYYKKLCVRFDLDITLRWVQLRLNSYRGKPPKPAIRLTQRELKDLMTLAQANADLVAALENGAEFQTFARECKKLAIPNEKLQVIMERKQFDPPEFDYELLLNLRNVLRSAHKLAEKLDRDRIDPYVAALHGEWRYIQQQIPKILDKIEQSISQVELMEGRTDSSQPKTIRSAGRVGADGPLLVGGKMAVGEGVIARAAS
jgi:hypothetical protein